MSNTARLCASVSILAIFATPALAQSIGAGLQPEYVIVTADRGSADPSTPDTQITAETHRLAALKAHKQGLMQQLFPAPETADA